MKLFPPIVTGTVVSLIGLTLLPVSIDWAAGGVGSANYGSLKKYFYCFIYNDSYIITKSLWKGISK